MLIPKVPLPVQELPPERVRRIGAALTCLGFPMAFGAVALILYVYAQLPQKPRAEPDLGATLFLGFFLVFSTVAIVGGVTMWITGRRSPNLLWIFGLLMTVFVAAGVLTRWAG